VVQTKRPKTSVYFHIRHIHLPENRKQEIRRVATQRFINYNKNRKGKSRLNRHPIPFERWNTALVSLVGHLIFDGEIKHGGCVYTNRSLALLKHVNACMQTIYPFTPKRYESLPGVHKIGYHNVELNKFFKSKARELLVEAKGMEHELQRSFLRAFFDDEGSVYFIGNRRAVRGYQHNKNILHLIQHLLKNFGVESKVDITYNEITITRKENIARFSQEINFSKGLRINGNRSNSIWKKSLEKRELLRRALASYR